MRLHTDTITSQQIYHVANTFGVSVNELSSHGSRSHDHAFDVYLEGSSNRQSNGRDHKAATWDEWGMIMAALYVIDPDAMWGSKAWGYKNVHDFHTQTCDRFANGVPADLHTQHKWQYDHARSMPLSDVAYHYCTGCTARMRRG